jgi:uncharacterized protein YkwD
MSRPLALAVAIALSACGGGDERPCDTDRTAIVAMVNAERANGASCGVRGTYAPAGPVAWNARLEAAAAAHSADMAARGELSHFGSKGENLQARATAAGYTGILGENVAGGYDDAAAMVRDWMASDDHCAEVMQPRFKDVGLACVPSDGRYRSYWTMDLGG